MAGPPAGALVPFHYLIRAYQGGFYGWPYAHIGKHPMAGFANLAPDKVEAAITPGLLFTAHSSLLAGVLRGRPVPARKQGQSVCRPERLVEPLRADRLQGRARAVQGRPPRRLVREFCHRLLDVRRIARRGVGPLAALGVAKDSSLLVADDTGGTIWRIS